MPDHWTQVTADGSYSAHFEHTVAMTAEGPWVLTAPPQPGEEFDDSVLRELLGRVPQAASISVQGIRQSRADYFRKFGRPDFLLISGLCRSGRLPNIGLSSRWSWTDDFANELRFPAPFLRTCFLAVQLIPRIMAALWQRLRMHAALARMARRVVHDAGLLSRAKLSLAEEENRAEIVAVLVHATRAAAGHCSTAG